MIRRNQDEIGDNEILVVSFGTSFNDSRAADIKWYGRSHSGSISGLGSKQSIYRTDHYQSCTGKRWREDRQRRSGITDRAVDKRGKESGDPADTSDAWGRV